MRTGQRIWWKGMNRTESGVVESEDPHGWLVRLDNGKYAVVPEESVSHAE